MEARNRGTRWTILWGVWTGIGLCVVGTALMFVSADLDFGVLFCAFLAFGIIIWVAIGSSGALRDPERPRAADDGGASELGFITRGIRGDVTPYGRPTKRDP
jgi:hypothetical protein